jgi:hypothetical protein
MPYPVRKIDALQAQLAVTTVQVRQAAVPAAVPAAAQQQPPAAAPVRAESRQCSRRRPATAGQQA